MNKVLLASFCVFQLIIAGQHSTLEKVVVCKNLRGGLRDQLHRQRVHALSDDKDLVGNYSPPVKQFEKTKTHTQVEQCEENVQLQKRLLKDDDRQPENSFYDRYWRERIHKVPFYLGEKTKKQTKNTQLQEYLLKDDDRQSEIFLYDKDERGSIHIMPSRPVKKTTKKQIVIAWLKKNFLFCYGEKKKETDSGYASNKNTIQDDKTYVEWDDK
ncbi:hypothetical protein K9K77_03080 [Candidatus Babeliales bacterium]|nr:hypothetical protein [Candidatus Babeliales bacterium]